MIDIASARVSTRREGWPKIRVQTRRSILIAARIAAGLAVVAIAGLPAVPAAAILPPHVVADAQRGSTDSCAMCHRAHTADATVPYRTPDSIEATGSSLLIASDPAAGDVSLCFSCHGVAQLGSNKDVQSRFMLGSVHSLAPTTSPYGPSPLYCSSCHDSHGTARIAVDTPYPALLRSFEGTAPVYAGEEYCATCHSALTASANKERWAGLAVFKATRHYTGMSVPAAGAGIRCSICHDPHGSAVAPLLVTSLVPTSAPTTITVSADDRTFCGVCHGPASASWVGTDTYAASSHGASSKTVTITAQWVPAAQRKVGECQVCHAPMGRSDGAGGAIPKLLDAQGRALCDRCHTGGGAASTDTSSQARPVAGAPTLAAVYAPGNGTTPGLVSLYGLAASADTTLSGPREYAPASGTGPSACGDINGDGRPEIVVAAAGAARVSIYATDTLAGMALAPSTSIPIPAGVGVSSIAIANIVTNGLGWLIPDAPEIVVVTADHDLVVYGYSHGGSTLVTVGVTPLPAGPWGLATGDLDGNGHAEAVVTNAANHSITIVSDNGSGGTTATTTRIGVTPVAPSIGRLWNGAPAGQQQIAVCDSGSLTATVRVLDGSGTELGSYLVGSADGKPAASAVGNILPSASTPSAELAVAFVNASGDSTVVVLAQAVPGPGLNATPASTVPVGSRSHTGSLLAGDVDGDGRTELVAGNGGTWAAAGAVAPSLRVWHANLLGTQLAAPQVLGGGGTELAGAAPSLMIADLGPIFPSRHPIDEAAVTHVSTETVSAARHVTCPDCHNAHLADQSVGVAPFLVPGPLKGAFGLVGAETTVSVTEYGVCYKCHSSEAASQGRQNVAAQFAMTGVSRHAVEGQSASIIPSGTFVGSLTQASVLFCNDCHGDDGVGPSQVRDLHQSDSAPILSAPYLGVDPARSGLLCYRCHKYAVYATGADDGAGMSFFQTSGAAPKLLHSTHGGVGHGLSCSACHVSHGSATKPHLLRDDIGVTPDAVLPHAGSCTNACHGGIAKSWGTP